MEMVTSYVNKAGYEKKTKTKTKIPKLEYKLSDTKNKMLKKKID